MGYSSVVCIAASFAVLALLLGPAHGASCGMGTSAKFAANQTVSYPGPYYWQLSPCKGETWCPSVGKAYITQYGPEGACAPANLQCTEAPKTVTKTATGYTLNFFCGNIKPNGEKDAVVNIKCTSGPLKFIGASVPATSPSSNHFLYTFEMEGECSSFDYGWVFVIIVLVGLFLYFLGGFLFNFFVRKLRGLEAIPNVGFWKDLPGLVKDGFMFVFCRGRRSGFKSVA